MFTGLVQAVGEVESIESLSPEGGGVRLRVRAEGWGHRPESGDSVCVSGCCLTLAGPTQAVGGAILMDFDVIPESLKRTSLGALIRGSRVNLEASCTPATLLGGHIVQGHVEGLATVESVETEPAWVVTLRPPAALMPCITPKGSIAVDGVSLTIAEVDPKQTAFRVALIPTTLAHTTLGRTGVGKVCNIETDILARTVVHYLRHHAQGGSARGGA